MRKLKSKLFIVALILLFFQLVVIISISLKNRELKDRLEDSKTLNLQLVSSMYKLVNDEETSVGSSGQKALRAGFQFAFNFAKTDVDWSAMRTFFHIIKSSECEKLGIDLSVEDPELIKAIDESWNNG